MAGELASRAKRRRRRRGKVDLRPGSEISVDFSQGVRRIALLRGTAHFDVAPNPSRPFIVEAGNVSVRAVGTAFSVQVSDSNIEVLVTHGRVAVAPSATANPNDPAADADERSARTAHGASGAAEFAAGSRIVVGTAQHAMPQATLLSTEDLGQHLAWRSPRVEFLDTPLSEAVALMNRYGKTPIRIVDPALGRTRINGLFRADNTETFIELLEMSFNARSTREGGELVVDRAAVPAGR